MLLCLRGNHLIIKETLTDQEIEELKNIAPDDGYFYQIFKKDQDGEYRVVYRQNSKGCASMVVLINAKVSNNGTFVYVENTGRGQRLKEWCEHHIEYSHRSIDEYSS